MLVASVTGANSVDVASIDNTTSVDQKTGEVIKNEIQNPKTVEEIVEESFKDTPILAKVAFCESRNKQFDANGQILRGVQNPKDVGVMQINEYFHLETSEKLDMNIYTLEGNLAYAKHLYEQEGVKPWSSSSKCWNKGEIAMNN